MLKKIQELTKKEVDIICFGRRKKYGKDYKACCGKGKCPLRYGNTCLACQGFESMTKLINNIGQNLVEVESESN